MSAEQKEVATSMASTELSLPERAVAAMKLQVTAAQLTELASKTADIKAITNADGRKQAHAAAMVLADQRLAIDKAGKAARDDANKFAKAVIAEKDKLIGLIEPEEKRLLKLRDDWDEARAAEKRAKEEAERARMAAIGARIQDMRDAPAACVGKSAAEIQSVIQEFTAIVLTAENFAEFAGSAVEVHANILARLRSMHGQQVRIEQERAQAAEAEAKRKAELEAEIAKQRHEREVSQLRIKRIANINALVLVATIGRADRKPGTRECITETLAEAQRILINEAEFGDMLEGALAARASVVAQIEHTLKRFDDRAAEVERQRIEQQRLDAERAAAQAEHARIAQENQRQAEELRRQQEAIEQQRAELERQQQQIAATQSSPIPAVSTTEISGNALTEKFADGAVVTQELPPPAEEAFAPTADQLIALVACNYGVGPDIAAKWLRDCFGAVLT